MMTFVIAAAGGLASFVYRVWHAPKVKHFAVALLWYCMALSGAAFCYFIYLNIVPMFF
ncbi:hypothetical protein AB4Y96_00950 [Phyllobacterium sp. TAF24]|uniref:hypothetical protein n=1 Tax=unclassified Phyllobacterium TaxID=2638441 RepID=UPI000880B315|nr:hypothetical protein [Phyllobacterium sp. OV277]SDP59809.1 hypothetical protein SAMN05443582_106166 [Phyllobacterium sp. OV277]